MIVKLRRRAISFIEQAGDVVPARPLPISEHSNSGRVVQHIDGMFISPAPAAPVLATAPESSGKVLSYGPRIGSRTDGNPAFFLAETTPGN